jgi:hypothetical protein
VDRGTRNLLAVALVVVIAVTGGAALILGSPGAGEGNAPSGTSSMVGVIVHVDSEGLGSVRGFTLRREGGTLVDFRLDALENGAEFPPGHLAEHQATAEPVRVRYRDDAGVLLAIRLEDVGG